MAAWMACALVGAAGFASPAFAGFATIVVDAQSGKVLEQVNADQENIPASLTKMMTLYLTFQALQRGTLKLDQALPVSAQAAREAPTKLDLRAGQSVRVRDCILGMIVKSANDAATVVAERLGGSTAGFAKQMNAQAAKLGMTGTRFGNANGLPNSENRTTARDMARLAQALYRDYPQYASMFATRQFLFRGRLVRGHNRLMARYSGMDGLKTGYTEASGFNLASTAVRGGRRLFAVVLGGRTAQARDEAMAGLLDEAFTRMPAVEAKTSGTHKLLAALSPVSSAAAAEPVPVIAKIPASHAGKTGRIALSKARKQGVVCAPAVKHPVLAQKKHVKGRKAPLLAKR
ncbi:MAG: D-alanyl-D-alanine carboxypeptidase [Proteobacteria bacterium]|mgnify:CR=1 FL=1|nr:D-alanyl-D-alanine carboxypeptidase [Pseudomonadota bacterium]